jgi:hypothetical protein
VASSGATITESQAVSAAATSAALTATQAGDLIVVCAYQNNNDTAPSLASGYTNIANGGANTNAMRIAYKFSPGGETTTGTWTNATAVGAIVYRGVDVGPIGANAAGNNSGTTLTYSTVSLERTDGTSWIAGCGGMVATPADQAHSVNQNTTNLTVRTNIPSNQFAMLDSGAGLSSFSSQGVTITSGAWSTYAVELFLSPAKSAPPLYQSWTYGYPNELTAKNNFQLFFPNKTGAGNLQRLWITYPTGNAPTSITDGSSDVWTPVNVCTDSYLGLDHAMWIVAGATAGKTSATVNFSSAGTDGTDQLTAGYAEYYGIATSSPADQISCTPDISTALAGAGSMTPSTNGQLIDAECVGMAAGVFPSDDWSDAYIPASAQFVNTENHLGKMSMSFIQATEAAINPTMDIIGGTYANCAATSFKASAGAGTAPSGMYIAHGGYYGQFMTSTATYVLPTSGNLMIVGSTDLNEYGAVSDDNSNSYTSIFGTDYYPKLSYASPFTPRNNLHLTMGIGSSPNQFFSYWDVAGAASSGAYDTSNSSVGTQGALPTSCGQNAAKTDITGATVVPSTSNGLVIGLGNFGCGPPCAAAAPTGAFLDAVVYPGAGDGNEFDNGDGWIHYFNPNTAAVTFQWHMANTLCGAPTSYYSIAASFKGASAQSSTVRHRVQVIQHFDELDARPRGTGGPQGFEVQHP